MKFLVQPSNVKAGDKIAPAVVVELNSPGSVALKLMRVGNLDRAARKANKDKPLGASTFQDKPLGASTSTLHGNVDVGNKVDADGKPVDAYGKPVDAHGNYVHSDRVPVDVPFDANETAGSRLDHAGLVDHQGRHLDAAGNILDKEGNAIHTRVGQLSGNVNRPSIDNKVSFGDLNVSSPGVYKLVASVGKESCTSDQFDVE